MSCNPTLKDPPNGAVKCTGNQFKDKCTFTCDCGYKLGGSSVRACQENKAWSGTETQCTKELSTYGEYYVYFIKLDTVQVFYSTTKY